MLQDSWELYEEPAHPKKWIFHPRKRSIMMPLFSIVAAIVVLVEVFSRF